MQISGFYIGRFETSLDENNNAQSKKMKTAMNSLTWFQMYEYQKLYSNDNPNLGVESEMLWGSQWMQMLIFINNKIDKQGNVFYISQSGGRALDDINALTGNNIKDIVQNIYDIEGGRLELTQNANKRNFSSDSDPSARPDKNRWSRGGRNEKAYFATTCTRVTTISITDKVSSRMTLWIK